MKRRKKFISEYAFRKLQWKYCRKYYVLAKPHKTCSRKKIGGGSK